MVPGPVHQNGDTAPRLMPVLDETHEVARRWTQRRTGATCMRLEPRVSGTRGSLFVKIGAAEDQTWPARVHRIYSVLDEVAAGLAPKPVGYDTDPATICYEWVDGDVLHDHVQSLYDDSDHPRRDILDVAERVGGALSALHTAWTKADPPTDPRKALPKRLVVVSWMCGTTVTRRVAHPSRSPTDLGPWNIVVTCSDVVFIDLDAGPSRQPEIDLGMLALRMRASLYKWASMNGTARAGCAALARDVGTAVSTGYGNHLTPGGVNAPDRRLIHAAAATEALTASVYRLRRARNWSALRGSLRFMAWSGEHVVRAWLSHPPWPAHDLLPYSVDDRSGASEPHGGDLQPEHADDVG